MLTNIAAPAILAVAPPSAMLTNAAAPAILALAPDQSVTYILRGSAAAGGSVVLGFAVRARRLLRSYETTSSLLHSRKIPPLIKPIAFQVRQRGGRGRVSIRRRRRRRRRRCCCYGHVTAVQ